MDDPRIEFHPGARGDYLDALDWYLERSGTVANRFQVELSELLQWIVENAELAAPDSDGIRWRRMRRFPHVIYYRLLEDGIIQVLAVAHGRRRPNYWWGRL